MDRILFDHLLEECVEVDEKTQYLEILNYKASLSTGSTRQTHPLSQEDLHSFLWREGAFDPQDSLPREHKGEKPFSGLRLVNANTFKSHHISLKRAEYKNMMEAFRLPLRALEGTCTVGPFFWTGMEGRGANRCFQIMCRKSDVLKKGKTRGWELMLSYNFSTRITSGYLKTTPSAKPEQIMKLLMAESTAPSLAHPFVLPMLILSLNELSSENDDRQRQARELLRQLENAIAGREDADIKADHVKDGRFLILEQINRDLYECVCKVLWKRPRAYLSMLAEVSSGLKRWWSVVEPSVRNNEDIADLQESMVSKVNFHAVKLRGIESYAATSLERLRVQRESLYNIIAQRESKLNLVMAREQKIIANASKRDGTTMKTLSILGAIFLPGTYLASVFSMTFFNFQDSGVPKVSKDVWMYFALTIPITIFVVTAWFVLEARRKKEHKIQEEQVNDEWDRMEHTIMEQMRIKTIKHQQTTLPSVPTWRQGERPVDVERQGNAETSSLQARMEKLVGQIVT
ncbi:hypothetical protein BROUX41_002437 [Berkeleyomyces rouxiae]